MQSDGVEIEFVYTCASARFREIQYSSVAANRPLLSQDCMYAASRGLKGLGVEVIIRRIALNRVELTTTMMRI